MYSGQTQYQQTSHPGLSNLAAADPLRYVEVIHQDYNNGLPALDFVNQRSLYRMQLSFFTPLIPSEGYIEIVLDSAYVSLPTENRIA